MVEEEERPTHALFSFDIYYRNEHECISGVLPVNAEGKRPKFGAIHDFFNSNAVVEKKYKLAAKVRRGNYLTNYDVGSKLDIEYVKKTQDKFSNLGIALMICKWITAKYSSDISNKEEISSSCYM